MTPSMSRENRKLVGLAAGIGIGLGIVAVRHRGGHYNGLPDVLIIDPIIVLGCGFLVGSWAAGPR